MKNLFFQAKPMVLFFFITCICFSFQSCSNDDGQNEIESKVSVKIPCEDPIEASCVTNGCNCPTEFTAHNIVFPGQIIYIYEYGNPQSCFEISVEGEYCLGMKGGGWKPTKGTKYEITLKEFGSLAVLDEENTATISIEGVCNNSGTVTEHQLGGVNPPNIFWTQWACIAQEQPQDM